MVRWLIAILFFINATLHAQFTTRFTKDSFVNTTFRQMRWFHFWGSPAPNQFRFIDTCTVIFTYGETWPIKTYSLWLNYYTAPHPDTLHYNIVQDSIMVFKSPYNNKFWSKQKIDIQESNDFTCKWKSFYINGTNYLNNRIQNGLDTLTTQLNIEPLLLSHLTKPHIRIYINGKLYYNNALKKDTIVVLIDNFIKKTTDSARVNVIVNGLREGTEFTKSNTFYVKGIEQLNLALDIRYHYSFSVCPYQQMIIRNNALYNIDSEGKAGYDSYLKVR